MLNEMGIFLNDWSSIYNLMRDFGISEEDLEGVNILLADYTYIDYEGNAFVLFERNGKLYEVNGGHCSCYGLEGQWEPDEVFLEEIIRRPKNYHHETHREELEEILKLIQLTGDIDSVIVAMRLSYYKK